MSLNLLQEEERQKFQQALNQKARPSCVAHEMNMRNLSNALGRIGDSVLGEVRMSNIINYPGFRVCGLTLLCHLSQVHHDLAKYHELGRFAKEGEPNDLEAAVYHEEIAANLGIKEAIMTMAHIYLGQQHDILVQVVVEVSQLNFRVTHFQIDVVCISMDICFFHFQQNEENLNKGADYMMIAAEAGDRQAMLFMADAFESGKNLGRDRLVFSVWQV